MGGGAAMRAAAKAASYSAANSVLRGVSQIPSVEYPVSSAAAARKVSRPVSAIVSSSDDAVLTTAAHSSKIDATAERLYWESNDWEFAGGEEDMVLGHGDPIPRLVFGSAPTLHEAKEATSDLKDALEKVYSLSSSGSSESLVSEMSSKPESSDTKTFFIRETGLTSVSKPAIQAFKLLSENSAAQSVVASIASDPNVWLAVLENPDLKQYLHSQKNSVPCSVTEKECVSETKFQDDGAPESESLMNEGPKSGEGLFNNIKTKVIEMLDGLSGYFQNLFGGEKASLDVGENAKTKTSFMENPLTASFMGLAVIVILVVVLKRA